MAKTQKVLDIVEHGCWLICIKDLTSEYNKYKLFLKWYNPGTGYRRKLIAKYDNFTSVLIAAQNTYARLESK